MSRFLDVLNMFELNSFATPIRLDKIFQANVYCTFYWTSSRPRAEKPRCMISQASTLIADPFLSRLAGFVWINIERKIHLVAEQKKLQLPRVQ